MTLHFETLHILMFCFCFCQHIVPGACFLCNECPDSTRSGDSGGQGTDCTGRPRSEGSAACVETTGYALLALLEGGDTQHTVCLAQWLVRIRSGNGGFWSSQVCKYLHLSVPLNSLIGCFASLVAGHCGCPPSSGKVCREYLH